MIAALAAEIAGAFQVGDVAAVRVALEAIEALVGAPIGSVVDLAVVRKKKERAR
jgi:hypothetical protein